MTAPRGKQLPVPTPETAPYWEGCKQHELRLQYCTNCQKHFFYP
ncbi:MAG: zinc ribbon domain-containing protein, partial [Dehalococcoidia bacterium]